MTDENPTPDGPKSWSQRVPTSAFTAIGFVLGVVLVVGVVLAAGGFLSNSVQSHNVTLHAPNGPAVTFETNTTANLTQPFPDNNTVEFRSAEGNITLSSLNRTNATVTQITGTWTTLENLDVESANLTVEPEDKPFVIVGKQADHLSYRDPTLGDWDTDIKYGGASGETYLVVAGLPSDRKVKLLDKHTRVRLADDTTSATGVGVFTLPNSDHDAVFRPATYVTSNTSLPPYYKNSSDPGNLSQQVPSNASLDQLGKMLAQIEGLVIGYGDQIPGGNTYAGTIILGLVMGALFLGSVALTSVGVAGGAVVASVAGYGLVEIGLAPGWLRIVLLFMIGTVASVAALRVTQ